MSIIEQAKIELAAVNFGEEDSAVMIGILEKFFQQWDSGGAVHVAAEVLQRLIAGQPLAPLTGEDSEWHQPDPNSDLLQNVRCSSVFKAPDGHPYDIDLDGGSVAIAFPYEPQTKLPASPVMTSVNSPVKLCPSRHT